jgi:hypothetical protein
MAKMQIMQGSTCKVFHQKELAYVKNPQSKNGFAPMHNASPFQEDAHSDL